MVARTDDCLQDFRYIGIVRGNEGRDRETKRQQENRRNRLGRAGERKRESRHIDVHAFRSAHICNANLRGGRTGVEMEGLRELAGADRKGRP